MMIERGEWMQCSICGLEMRKEFYDIPEYRESMEQVHDLECALMSQRIIKDSDFSIDISGIS